jgi:hypothetical protein
MINEKINFLINNTPNLIKKFDYRKGPDLYFYKRIMGERRKRPLEELFDDNYFLELVYITLVAWDMNARGAKMKYFDEFKENILKNKRLFCELAKFKLEKLNEIDFIQVQALLGKLYDNLEMMKSKGRLVSNSKVMHFLLPDLVMPMDRQNTLMFYFGYTMESKGKFLKIIEASFKISKQIDLGKFLDNEWCLSIPKIIDNAVICANSSKYRK